VARVMIIISCLANCLIALYVYFIGGIADSDDFNLIQAKGQKQGFAGFTFLSQLYLFFLPYFIAFSLKEKLRWKKYVLLLVLSVFFRSFFYSERLALIELIVFLLVTFEYTKFFVLTYKKILVAILLFIVFFVGGELTRQFYAQYVIEAESKEIDWGFALSWSLERYAAYYADTTNKLYLILERIVF
jgi:hypothetical protein